MQQKDKRLVKYYQPVLQDSEWGILLCSFQVYYNKTKLEKDFPGREIKEYSGDDIENPTFVDEREYYVMHNVGKVKYLLNYHDGINIHKDGSPFFDAKCFSNKKKLNKAIGELKKQGFTER